MKSVDEYLKKYGSVDEEIKRRYGTEDDSGFYYLENQDSWRYMRDDLYYCRDIRNYLTHGRKICGQYPFAGIEDGMFEFLEYVEEKIRNPETAAVVMVKMQKVYTCRIEDGVRNAMKTMKEKQFTHVPIVDENGYIRGIFSENTLLNYMIKEEIVLIDDSTTFENLKGYLSKENDDSEKYGFIPKDMMLSLIQDKFIDAVKQGNRMGMLFVTHSGSEKEKPLGIITAWDVAGNYVMA